MATSKIQVTEGLGKNIATHSFSEDGVTKEIQRVAIANSSGTDITPLSESDFDTKIGATNESAPASDTASSGLNGRLQRIAQRITSLIALVPAALTGSGNFKVSLQESNASQATTIVDGGNVTLGSKADAKSTATDTTSVSIMSVLKQISASVQAAASSLAGTITVAAHAVTNAGTFAVQDSEKIADDAAFTVGTTKVMPSGFLADESSTDSVDEGDIGIARMTLDRKQHVVTELESNSLRAGGTALTPKFVAIAASSSGNNTVLAAVNPKKIRVLAVQLVANGAVNAKWQSGASGTDLTGLAYLAANGGYVLPFNPVGWFETASNTLLNLNLSGAVAVGGSITYVEV